MLLFACGPTNFSSATASRFPCHEDLLCRRTAPPLANLRFAAVNAYLRWIVKKNPWSTVGQLISESVLVAVVNPFGDEDRNSRSIYLQVIWNCELSRSYIKRGKRKSLWSPSLFLSPLKFSWEFRDHVGNVNSPLVADHYKKLHFIPPHPTPASTSSYAHSRTHFSKNLNKEIKL